MIRARNIPEFVTHILLLAESERAIFQRTRVAPSPRGARQNSTAMGKKRQVRKSRKLQENLGDDGILQNKVHQLIEYIENKFSDKGRVKRSFATAALTGALKFLDEISEAEGITDAKKIELLTTVYQAANVRIEGLTASSTIMPLALWAERKERFMSPCDFTIQNYATYGRRLNLAQVRQADPKLYQALMRLKSESGWPSTFDIPSKSAQMDSLVQKASDTNLVQRDDLPPAERKRRRQIVNARRYRERESQ
jgi:hypothetical protein